MTKRNVTGKLHPCKGIGGKPGDEYRDDGTRHGDNNAVKETAQHSPLLQDDTVILDSKLKRRLESRPPAGGGDEVGGAE